MPTIDPRLTGLPARTHLRGGEWRCYPMVDYGHFACVNTADAEILTGAMTTGITAGRTGETGRLSTGPLRGKTKKLFTRRSSSAFRTRQKMQPLTRSCA